MQNLSIHLFNNLLELRITDEEAVSMSRFLVQRDGLFLGSSSACNLVACVKLVRKMGWRDGEKVVTILYAFITRITLQMR